MTQDSKLWILYDSLYKTQSSAVSTEDIQMSIFKMSERDTARFFIWTAGWEKWQQLKAYLESNQKHFVSSFPVNQVSEDTIAVREKIKTVSERPVIEMKPADKEVEEEVTKSSFYYSVTKAFSDISLEEKDIMAEEDQNLFSYKFDADDVSVSDTKKPKVNFKKINSNNALKSRSDRHELKIEILLISAKGKTFRSRSRNISMSGSLLEDNIPFDYCERIFDIVVINTQPCDPKLQRVSLRAKTVGKGLTQRIHFVNMTATIKKALQALLENYLETQEKIQKTG